MEFYCNHYYLPNQDGNSRIAWLISSNYVCSERENDDGGGVYSTNDIIIGRVCAACCCECGSRSEKGAWARLDLALWAEEYIFLVSEHELAG